MIATNNITKGLYLGVDPHYQPPGTVIKNHNGQFLDYSDGSFIWKGSDGNELISVLLYGTTFPFSILELTIMGITELNGDIILIGKKESTGLDYVGKLVFNDGSLKQATYYHFISDENLELNISNPLRQFFAVYENENNQRIYWNDGIKSPRSLNLAGDLTSINVDLLNFTPPSDIGLIEYDSEIDGSLDCASYSFIFRLVTDDGAVTDYSLPTVPVPVNKLRASSNLGYYDQYQNQGDNFTEKSQSGLRLKITDVDIRYDSIQVVAFKSIAPNSFQPGILIYDDEIGDDSEIIIDFRGNENLGVVTSDQINISTKFIITAQLMELIKNTNTLADYAERTEIPEGDIIKYNKINGVTLDKEVYRIPLDSKVGLERWKKTDTLDSKPLSGVKYNPGYRYKDFWYKKADDTFVLGDGLTAMTTGEIPYLRIKRYTEADGTIVYKNISLQDDYLNYRSQKIAALLKGHMGMETYRYGVVLIKDGKPYGVRWIGDKQFPSRSTYWNMVTVNSYSAGVIADNHVMGNIMSLIINDLDLSELVTTDPSTGNAISCDIDGFAIVRCERDVQLISQGLLTPMLVSVDEDHPRNVIVCPSTYYASGWDGVDYKDRRKYAYTYYSPDVLFRAPNKNISIGDKLRVHTYLHALYNDNTGAGPVIIDPSSGGDDDIWANKYYFDDSFSYGKPYIYLPDYLTENEIRAVYDFPFNADGSGDVYDVVLNKTFRNEASIDGIKLGYGTDSKIVILTNEEASDASSFACWQQNALSIVDHYIPKTNLYGGTSDAALAGNIYYGTGHYQEITLDILNSIKNAEGKFEFNGIQVFGGDTFITLFDLQRIVMNDRSGDNFAQGMIFPVQTTINTEMRTGDHFNKDRTYHKDNNPTGIGVSGSYTRLEDFNYNDAYSTSKTEKFYLPLPFGFKSVSESKFNVLWSNEKTPGEKIDNYRLFPVNNIRPVEQSFGFITALINMRDKLVYLQQKGVGYIPIGERVTINSNEAQPVQLGVGGKFDRYDTTNEFYGCQHYFSVCKVPGGIVWFDFNNRSFVFLQSNMQLSDESIIKGMEPFFNDLDPDLKNYDRPYRDHGIYTFYDKKRKEVVMVFKEPDGTENAITFNQKSNVFTGTLDLIPSVVYSKMDYVLSTQKGNYNIWVHNQENSRSYYGTSYDAYLKFVINNEPLENKIYDMFSVIGNENFFNSITYKGKNFGPVTENIIDNDGNVLSDYIKYLNFEWRGSYPLGTQGERLRGHYAEIQFKLNKENANDVRLLNMKTVNRKTE